MRDITLHKSTPVILSSSTKWLQNVALQWTARPHYSVQNSGWRQRNVLLQHLGMVSLWMMDAKRLKPSPKCRASAAQKHHATLHYRPRRSVSPVSPLRCETRRDERFSDETLPTEATKSCDHQFHLSLLSMNRFGPRASPLHYDCDCMNTQWVDFTYSTATVVPRVGSISRSARRKIASITSVNCCRWIDLDLDLLQYTVTATVVRHGESLSRSALSESDRVVVNNEDFPVAHYRNKMIIEMIKFCSGIISKWNVFHVKSKTIIQSCIIVIWICMV